jgi:hypothetical protein
MQRMKLENGVALAMLIIFSGKMSQGLRLKSSQQHMLEGCVAGMKTTTPLRGVVIEFAGR